MPNDQEPSAILKEIHELAEKAGRTAGTPPEVKAALERIATLASRTIDVDHETSDIPKTENQSL